jgi:hypothetical protein
MRPIVRRFGFFLFRDRAALLALVGPQACDPGRNRALFRRMYVIGKSRPKHWEASQTLLNRVEVRYQGMGSRGRKRGCRIRSVVAASISQRR